MIFKLIKQLQTFSWQFWLISLVFLGITACTPPNAIVEETVTQEATSVGETAVSPTPLASSTPQPTIQTQPAFTPTITMTPTSVPTRTPQPTLPPSHLITDDPIFTGGDLQFVKWSPNGRYLAYFEYTDEQVATSLVEGLRGTYPGTFVFYDTHTGEKCTDYPLGGFFPYEGPGNGAQWRWLPDGRLLINLPDGQLLRTAMPCDAGENIATQFDEPITSFGEFSPDERWLVLTGDQQYWLYDWSTEAVHPIADVQPDSFNNLVWSPDSQHISITLAGGYAEGLSPIGGTRVIDVATGATIAQYDWEPANALDGTFGGPVWINNDEFVVTLTMDQGPFLMNTSGDVQPLLPLFDETFEPENYWPPLDVYTEIENGRYALLRGNSGNQPEAKLYTFTPESETVEVFDQTSQLFYIFPNGEVGYEENGRYWMRPVFEASASFVEQPATTDPWLPTKNNNQLFVTANSNSILVYDQASGELIERLQFAGYEGGHNLYAILSPDEQWLAVFVHEPKYSLGKALFVVPAPSN